MIEIEHTTLRPELVVYEAALARLLPLHEGEFVVIKGAQMLHYADSYDEALDWAYSNLELDTFFVKKVARADLSTVHYTRDLGLCRN